MSKPYADGKNDINIKTPQLDEATAVKKYKQISDKLEKIAKFDKEEKILDDKLKAEEEEKDIKVKKLKDGINELNKEQEENTKRLRGLEKFYGTHGPLKQNHLMYEIEEREEKLKEIEEELKKYHCSICGKELTAKGSIVPVIALNKKTYDKICLKKWISKNIQDPTLDGGKVDCITIVPNHFLKERIHKLHQEKFELEKQLKELKPTNEMGNKLK